MRHYPTDEDDFKTAIDVIKAEEWQLNLLKLNPGYVHWGNFEDSMATDKGQWTSRLSIPTWKQFFSDWNLDDYNELVNFYFEVYRKSHECPHCEGTALNPATKQLEDDWYDFAGTGRKWCYSLTEIEIEALVKAGRLSDVIKDRVHFDDEKQKWQKLEVNGDDRKWVDSEAPEMPTPEKVNKWASGPGFGHDAINRWVAVKARAKHQGIYGHCEHCIDGRIYDEENAKVGLQLWILHPRKGAARGVYIEHLQQEDLVEVFLFLREAAERNAERFSKIPNG